MQKNEAVEKHMCSSFSDLGNKGFYSHKQHYVLSLSITWMYIGHSLKPHGIAAEFTFHSDVEPIYLAPPPCPIYIL